MAKQLQSKRILNDNFIFHLQKDFLKPILQAVLDDNNLILEIRQNYINIYYRGGNLLKLKQTNDGYIAEFDAKYCKNEKYQKMVHDIIEVKTIKSLNESIHWADNFHFLKQVMDYYNNSNEKLEKEFQQLVVRENNRLRSANDTDYYIIDYEYTSNVMKDARFDLIALRWDSTPNDRKNPNNCSLAIIEMKYGDDALDNDSGIKSHIDDVDKFLGNKEYFENFKTEMLDVFKQKRELGLIRLGKSSKKENNNEVVSINDKPEFIFLFAGHKPVKSKLKTIIDHVEPMKNAELKFATASFMGYSLYNENVLSLSDFKRLLK